MVAGGWNLAMLCTYYTPYTVRKKNEDKTDLKFINAVLDTRGGFLKIHVGSFCESHCICGCSKASVLQNREFQRDPSVFCKM